MGISTKEATGSETVSHPARAAAFCEVIGERAVLLGHESGVFEAWMWPLKLFHDLALSVRPEGEVDFVPFASLPRRVEVRPAGLRFTAPGRGWALAWELFACRDERGLVAHFTALAPRPLELELSFTCDFRPMWPAGLGGQIASVDEPSGALLLTEELGRFAALVGGPWWTPGSSGADHALVREPVRQRARLVPGEPTLWIVAGAEREPEPLSEAARLGLEQSATGLARARPVIDEARKLHGELRTAWKARRDAAEAAARRFHAATLRIQTPDPDLDQAFANAKTVIDRSWARVDGIGRGIVAGLGPSRGGERPGYGWFFDGDALVASRALSLLGGFDEARSILRFAASHQRADGKLMHELTLSARLCDWLGDYPYAYYKGLNGADFVSALELFHRVSGDAELVRELAPVVVKAVDFYAGCVDERGLVLNRRAGIAAVEAGELSDRIESELFLQSAVLEAVAAAVRLGPLLGNEAFLDRARGLEARLREGLERFWSAKDGRYGFALLEGDERLDVRSTYTAAALARGHGQDDRRRASAAQLVHPELAADWGLRMFAESAPFYDPEAYNTGAVFPYLTNFATLALYREGPLAAAHQLLASQVALDGLGGHGLIEEHLVGDTLRLPGRGVPHQVFSSAAIPESVLAGLLGLRFEAAFPGDASGTAGRLTLAPALPPSWERARLGGSRLGGVRLEVSLEREREAGATRYTATVEHGGGRPVGLVLEPRTPPGSSASKPARGLLAAGSLELQVRVVEGPSLTLPSALPALGEASANPRLLAERAEAGSVRWELAGRAGTTVRVGLRADVPGTVAGAVEVEEGAYEVAFPVGDAAWTTAELTWSRA